MKTSQTYEAPYYLTNFVKSRWFRSPLHTLITPNIVFIKDHIRVIRISLVDLACVVLVRCPCPLSVRGSHHVKSDKLDLKIGWPGRSLTRSTVWATFFSAKSHAFPAHAWAHASGVFGRWSVASKVTESPP